MQILLGVADMCECDIDDRNIMPLYDVRGSLVWFIHEDILE